MTLSRTSHDPPWTGQREALAVFCYLLSYSTNLPWKLRESCKDNGTRGEMSRYLLAGLPSLPSTSPTGNASPTQAARSPRKNCFLPALPPGVPTTQGILGPEGLRYSDLINIFYISFYKSSNIPGCGLQATSQGWLVQRTTSCRVF